MDHHITSTQYSYKHALKRQIITQNQIYHQKEHLKIQECDTDHLERQKPSSDMYSCLGPLKGFMT